MSCEKMLAVCFVLGFAVCLFLTGNIFQWVESRKLRRNIRELESELGQYRNRVSVFEESERELACTIDRARGIVKETVGSLLRIGKSVQDLRSGIAVVQKYVKELENCLYYNTIKDCVIVSK
jgi:septal ring factor EnvC (AmiA/AmiB activator)